MSAVKDAFNAWWDGIARQGDPIRRPRLTEEAFDAGYRAAASDLLTTRDQFAMRAMQALVPIPGLPVDEALAAKAYEIADWMLKARRA